MKKLLGSNQGEGSGRKLNTNDFRTQVVAVDNNWRGRRDLVTNKNFSSKFFSQPASRKIVCPYFAANFQIPTQRQAVVFAQLRCGVDGI